jgi:hypothetical protein
MSNNDLDDAIRLLTVFQAESSNLESQGLSNYRFAEQLESRLPKNFHSELDRISKSPNISPSAKYQLDMIGVSLAGMHANAWLPSGVVRKVIMILIFLVGIVLFVITNNAYFLLSWVLLAFFSPRITLTAAYMLGSFQAGRDSAKK